LNQLVLILQRSCQGYKSVWMHLKQRTNALGCQGLRNEKWFYSFYHADDGILSKFWYIEFAFCLAIVHNSHPLFVLEILIMMIVNMNSSFDVFKTRIVRKRYKLHMFKALTYLL